MAQKAKTIVATILNCHSLQTTLPLLDDLLSVTVKLESELESVCGVFTTFLECVQKLRDSAVNTQSNGN